MHFSQLWYIVEGTMDLFALIFFSFGMKKSDIVRHCYYNINVLIETSNHKICNFNSFYTFL